MDGDRPSRVGRYEIESQLGEGGMGVVYLARDTELGRRVALKILRAADPRLVARFQREAQNAAKLQHPNIATVYEAGRDGDTFFIAMEFVDGLPLSVWRCQRKPDVAAVVRVMARTARAVEAAHARGIVHRDVKPGNILVDAAGEPHVVDFGLSHAVESDHALTRSGTAVGTPTYMAPEQVRGEVREVDARSDVYALGVILHEALAGQPPFRAGSTVELYQQILTWDPPRIAGLPPPLQAVILRAMHRDKSRRYATAAELADDLDRFLAGEEVRARSPSGVSRAWKTVRPRVFPVVAVSLAIVATAAVAVRVSRREPAPPPPPPSPDVARIERRQKELDPELDRAMREIESAVRLCFRDWDHERWERHLDAAMRIVETVVAADPEYARAHYLRGRLHAERMDLEPAIAALTLCLELNPGYTLARMERGRALLWLAQTYVFRGESQREDADRRREELAGRAVADLRQAEQVRFVSALVLFGEGRRDEVLALDAGSFEWELRDQVLLLQALVHLSARRMEQALPFFERALRERPVNPLALCGRGIVLRVLGREREACADLDLALAIRPGWDAALMTRGLARLGLQDLDGALADFARVREIAPDCSEAHFGYAATLAHKGRWREVAEACTEALARTRWREGDVLDLRGTARFSLRDFDGAIEDFTREIELDPQCAPAYYMRGVVHRAAGRADRALPDFERAVELQPDHVDARYERAMLREAAGDRTGAREDYEAALRLARPNWGPRRDAERRLAALKGRP